MAKNTALNIGIVQQKCTTDTQENLQKTAQMIELCAAQGAQLIVLQELHNNVYFCQSEQAHYFDLAEPIHGPTTIFLSEIAKKFKLVIVSSIFEKRAPGLYHNTSVVIESDGTVAGIYRKMHIPDDPAYYEKYYFTPGDLGFQPIDTSVGKLGVLICWDQWYPEAARLMALAGAEILIYPTAIGYESTDSDAEKNRQREAWTIAQRAHAVSNGLHVVSVNRVGFEADPTGATNGITFWGSSFVCGPQGEFLFKANQENEISSVISIDLTKTETVRRWWPFFRDRRIDAFADLTKRFRD